MYSVYPIDADSTIIFSLEFLDSYMVSKIKLNDVSDHYL